MNPIHHQFPDPTDSRNRDKFLSHSSPTSILPTIRESNSIKNQNFLINPITKIISDKITSKSPKKPLSKLTKKLSSFISEICLNLSTISTKYEKFLKNPILGEILPSMPENFQGKNENLFFSLFSEQNFLMEDSLKGFFDMENIFEEIKKIISKLERNFRDDKGLLGQKKKKLFSNTQLMESLRGSSHNMDGSCSDKNDFIILKSSSRKGSSDEKIN